MGRSGYSLGDKVSREEYSPRGVHGEKERGRKPNVLRYLGSWAGWE